LKTKHYQFKPVLGTKYAIAIHANRKTRASPKTETNVITPRGKCYYNSISFIILFRCVRN